jgi:RNA recognition motif-containing protein
MKEVQQVSYKLYIGNLPFSATQEDLLNLFSACGTVEDIKLPTNRETGNPRGFGFVEMETKEGMKNAIDTLNDASIGGRNIKVAEAIERNSNVSHNNGSSMYAISKGTGTCFFCGKNDTIYGFSSTTEGVCSSCISSLSKASRPRNSTRYPGGYKKHY